MRYIALTVGPIVDTLILGRKTSEIWMASYLFSVLMKNIIREIKALENTTFIVPYVDDETLFEIEDDGVGMFHDRFILQTGSLTLEEVASIVQEQKEGIALMIAESIKRAPQKVVAFFNNYIQTYLFESDEQFDDPIIEISKILDSIELHTPRLEAEEDYLRLFLNRDVLLHSALAKASFSSKPSFDSIEAIAAQELGEEVQATNAYKYIAIVHADGDNLGAYIKAQDDVTQISKRLFDFDKSAAESIKAYGGMPLFIGGDDLLFFAPVIHGEETLFDLIDTLSAAYKDALGSDKTTLSFGVSVTYYKYPLYEALERSREALFTTAKRYTGKNAVAISAQKHSGQSFTFCVGKDEEAYRVYTAFVKTVLNEAQELPHAIHHKLFKHKVLFENIAPEQLHATFENIFNEEIHQSKFKAGLDNLQKLFLTLGLEAAAQEKLFAMLSTIKLLRGDR